jgi:hypothetical protein
MKVVGDQGPGQTMGVGIFHNPAKACEKIFAISVIAKNFSTLDTPSYDMMQGSGSIYP